VKLRQARETNTRITADLERAGERAAQEQALRKMSEAEWSRKWEEEGRQRDQRAQVVRMQDEERVRTRERERHEEASERDRQERERESERAITEEREEEMRARARGLEARISFMEDEQMHVTQVCLVQVSCGRSDMVSQEGTGASVLPALDVSLHWKHSLQDGNAVHKARLQLCRE
jgi:FKBP-type peptidyl-prolyl cis-trans isomerase